MNDEREVLANRLADAADYLLQRGPTGHAVMRLTRTLRDFRDHRPETTMTRFGGTPMACETTP